MIGVVYTVGQQNEQVEGDSPAHQIIGLAIDRMAK